MSRKDYRAMAHALNIRYRYADSDAERALILAIAGDIAEVFKADNSRFDFGRFRDAVTAECAR